MKNLMSIWMIPVMSIALMSANASANPGDSAGIHEPFLRVEQGLKRMLITQNTQTEDDPATDDGEDLRDGDSDSNSDADSDRDDG